MRSPPVKDKKPRLTAKDVNEDREQKIKCARADFISNTGLQKRVCTKHLSRFRRSYIENAAVFKHCDLETHQYPRAGRSKSMGSG